MFLSAVDTSGGIHYDVALVVYSIVAGNRPPDNRPYYFFVGPDIEERYAVVPSFENWRFLRNDLPTPWRGAFSGSSDSSLLDIDAQQAVRPRDRGCRVTGFLEATGAAHLAPAETAGWFEANRMERYCRVLNRANPIDDDANMILRRRDLHFMFDRRRFVMVRKSQHESPVVDVLLPGGWKLEYRISSMFVSLLSVIISVYIPNYIGCGEDVAEYTSMESQKVSRKL
ncbi:hypothetical protein GGR58DRAFT_523441 [Xylaria digitata]|nr:hypothetical protein GGR58DRAFT_523441 [Xylaria digitata]